MDYRSEAPEVIQSFLIYHETIKGHSKKTVDEYYLDLRTFFRFLKVHKGLVPKETDSDQIKISDITLDFVRQISLSDVYAFLSFLSREGKSQGSGTGLSANARARKVATIRSYFKYLTVKAKLLDVNPVQDLDSPKVSKTLPRYLSLDESKQLLASVDGRYRQRDYCILTIFLNCGLRISELVGLNLSDIHEDHLRVIGKGDKERIVYINDACVAAINDYLAIRKDIPTTEKNAFFLSSQRKRISRSNVHSLVKKHLLDAGLDSTKYSSHKLRHTAATLMLHNGVDVRTLQELLGHEHLNTTEIYTHVENEGLKQAALLSPLSDFSPDKNKKS